VQTRLFTLVLGLFYLVIGIISFIPALYTHPPASAPHLTVTASYGYLFGIFPVNAVADIFNIVIGLVAVAVSSRMEAAAAYCRALFPLFGILAVMGFMPQTNTVWGLAPILDGDTWVHAVTAILAAYFGFVAPAPSYVAPAPQHAHS